VSYVEDGVLGGIGRLRRYQSGPSLKKKLQSKLHGTWTALLVLRRDGAEAGVKHLGGLAKCGVGIDRVDISEIRVIQCVEGLGTELKPCFVSEGKLAPHGHVGLEFAEASHEIPGCVAHTRPWRGCESGFINRPPSRILASS
jgi:hypothetical protein